MDLELNGSVAVVTGASRGLGRAISLALVAEGVRVVAAARSSDELERLADEAGDDRVLAAPCDMTDPTAVGSLIDRAVAWAGKLDIVVNNAGIAPAGGLVDQDVDVWRRVFEINALAPMVLASAAARHLMARNAPGKVINVASTTGLRGKPHLSAYSGSKAAIVRMTESMAAEWAGADIQVNAIAPGAFRTDAQRVVLENEDIYAKRVRRIPQRRIAEPEEIGDLACYLASPRSRFVTGSTYVIDGGEVAKL